MKEIEISHEIPPVYELLNKKFGVKWDDKIIIAYGGKIHCKDTPAPQKIIHEKVHLDEQKKIGNELWWKAYLEDDNFRLQEELKAYRIESNFLKKYIKNREVRFHAINEIADSLSSPVYGSIITKKEALSYLLK